MKLQTVLRACRKISEIRLKQHPDTKVKVNDELIRLDELVTELENLESWCYKGELEVEKITRCKNCKHYKRYKKKSTKSPYKHDIVYACEYTKFEHNPEFFCARGEEKER